MLFYGDLIQIAAAVLPALFLLYKVYQADRIEKEPPGLLISLVLYGILATGLAMVAEMVGGTVVGVLFPENSLLYRLFFYFGVVALAEEGAKYVLLKRRTWYSPAFNYQFDGLVYAVFVSLGFALWENISYVAMYGLQVALLRAVTAIPGHACFGVFMGVWYGLAKKFERRGDQEKAQRYCRMAFLVPAFLHGSYDFIASMESGLWSLLFVIFIVTLFVVALRLVKRQSAYDRYLDGISGRIRWYR